jgi:hypothetical protein
MEPLPPDAKNITGCEPFGVDDHGRDVFFGFGLENAPRAVLHCNHLTLGKAIGYLQTVAAEALRRRLKANPLSADIEAQETQANPIVRMGFDMGMAGQSARLMWTTPSGIGGALQLSYDLIDKMYQELPALMEEMQKRQTAHKRPN